MNLKIYLTALAVLSFSCAFSQFRLLGTADYISGNCIQLTPDVEYSNGLAYHYTKLDLEGYFEIQFDIFLGNKDEGADGITFVIHNDPREFDAFGTWGECMGYGRWHPDAVWASSITPSVAIEFDTYQNLQQLDPYSDHVAYLENGISMHPTFWNNNDKAFDIEDDQMHDFRFRWDPSIQMITVLLDGNTVYEGKRDLIDDVFGGATQVIWGFTASTGRKSNLQYFCLRNLVKADGNESVSPNGMDFPTQPIKSVASINE
ncbi:L-type lectin-domain containing protein [Flammeovirgaceae bacterium SG7u.111]|nr:L-type lectin-domain containing protein [Flammeovirgaceae bacterium SG7u.132]WPO33474.1 L-type lectin-domain containing protein [Flammeovirgaceae bacterium SG7u.111]